MPKTFLFQAIQFSQNILNQTIQFSIIIVFVYTELNVKTVQFQAIPFSIGTDRILSGANSLDQSEPGSNSNDGILHIPQSFSITGTLPSDLVTYPGHWLGERSYPFAEKQLVYSTAPADWATSLFWSLQEDVKSPLMVSLFNDINLQGLFNAKAFYFILFFLKKNSSDII